MTILAHCLSVGDMATHCRRSCERHGISGDETLLLGWHTALVLVTWQTIADAAVRAMASAAIHEAVKYNIQVHILAIVSQLLDDALDLQSKSGLFLVSELRRSSISSRPLKATNYIHLLPSFLS